MNIRKLINTVLAGTLALTMVAGAAAQSTDTKMGEAVVVVAANTTAPVFTVAISNANFGTHEYSLADQPGSPQPIVVTVTDSRGSNSGWNVTLSGTAFSSVTTSTPFGIGNLVLGSATIAPNGGTYPLTGISGTPGTVLSSPNTIVTASSGNGTGKFDVTFANSTLNIPGGTLPGSYSSTLTVTLTAAQP